MVRDGTVKIEPVFCRYIGGSKNRSTNADCKCGHKFVEHRQLKIINYCIGDDFLCKCDKYDGKYDLEKIKNESNP
jgi:hypothetical protein